MTDYDYRIGAIDEKEYNAFLNSIDDIELEHEFSRICRMIESQIHIYDLFLNSTKFEGYLKRLMHHGYINKYCIHRSEGDYSLYIVILKGDFSYIIYNK